MESFRSHISVLVLASLSFLLALVAACTRFFLAGPACLMCAQRTKNRREDAHGAIFYVHKLSRRTISSPSYYIYLRVFGSGVCTTARCIKNLGPIYYVALVQFHRFFLLNCETVFYVAQIINVLRALRLTR